MTSSSQGHARQWYQAAQNEAPWSLEIARKVADLKKQPWHDDANLAALLNPFMANNIVLDGQVWCFNGERRKSSVDCQSSIPMPRCVSRRCAS